MLYAAGALEPDTAAGIADHLERGGPDCEQHLAVAAATLAALAMPEDPTTPPAHLKQRVMTEIGHLAAETGSAPDPPEAGPEATAAADQPDQPTRFQHSERSPRLRRLVAPALAAAVAALMTYSGMTLSTDPAQREIETLRSELREMREAEDRLARLNAIMNDWGTVVRTLASSAARIVPLKEVSEKGDASGRFLVDPERRMGCLLISGLKPPESEGRDAYPVWLVTEDGGPREVGSLRVDSTGRGWLVAEFTDDALSNAVKIHVGYRSDDPEAGESGRTLLAGDFTQQQ